MFFIAFQTSFFCYLETYSNYIGLCILFSGTVAAGFRSLTANPKLILTGEMRMRTLLKKSIVLIAVLAVAVLIIPAAVVSEAGTGDGSILDKKNFGGPGRDSNNKVVAASDGFIAAGFSDAASFGKNDWKGVAGKGQIDATIVNYDHDSKAIWKKNFGGAGNDFFYSVTEVSDGFVAVGYSTLLSFGNGDWADVESKGGGDAIIVKYSTSGTLMWKNHFGGASTDYFESITAVGDGLVVVGYSEFNSFGNGDLSDHEGRGMMDAIIVKYDNEGELLWVNSFGGSGNDHFESVTSVEGGVVAVGYSDSSSVGNGDLTGLRGRGGMDATLVKYNNAGELVWKNVFGGSGGDYFRAVIAVSEGVVAVGYSMGSSFGSGDFSDISGRGGEDAIIVKFDHNGRSIWKNNFGGFGSDRYYAVTAVSGGFVGVGYSAQMSFGNGDWEEQTGWGGDDAIAVKHDLNGDVTWKNRFGGSDEDCYFSVARVSDHIVATGHSRKASFGNGDWEDFKGKGDNDTIYVNYDITGFVAVEGIVNVPSSVTIGKETVLRGKVVPTDATAWRIQWAVKDAGTTEAVITVAQDGRLLFKATEEGSAIITATIANGAAPGTSFEQDFTITAEPPSDSDMMLWAVLAVAVIVFIAVASYVLIKKKPK